MGEVYSLQTIADLRNASLIAPVVVLGSVTVGDGGGGVYVYILSANPPADDGVTVILPTKPRELGYWLRCPVNPLRPTVYYPTVVPLTDGATIATDASLGNDFTVTINGSRTFAAPTNPTNGQRIQYLITQGAGAPYTPTFNAAFNFGMLSPTWSTTAGKTDQLLARYNATSAKWDVLGFQAGY